MRLVKEERAVHAWMCQLACRGFLLVFIMLSAVFLLQKQEHSLREWAASLRAESIAEAQQSLALIRQADDKALRACREGEEHYHLEQVTTYPGNDLFPSKRFQLSVSECTSECDNRGAACVGFVVDLGTNRCWFKVTWGEPTTHAGAQAWSKCALVQAVAIETQSTATAEAAEETEASQPAKLEEMEPADPILPVDVPPVDITPEPENPPQEPASEGPFKTQALTRLLALDPQEKFLWYAPHSGFDNQRHSFINALRVAGILKRTLIVPPVFNHWDTYFGSCSRSVRDAQSMRSDAWKLMVSRLRKPYYISMADVVNTSSLATDLVRTIDLRLFVTLRCGVDVTPSFANCAWCDSWLQALAAERQAHPLKQQLSMEECAKELGILKMPGGSTPLGYQVLREDRSCINSKFTYQRREDKSLAADDRPHMVSQCGAENPSTRRRRQLLALERRELLGGHTVVNVAESLGKPGSPEAQADVIAWGSMLNGFDFAVPMGDPVADRLSCSTGRIHFNREIVQQAQAFIAQKLQKPFACLHIRGHDKNKLKSMTKALKELKKALKAPQPGAVPLFVMSDKPNSNWQAQLREQIAGLGYDIKFSSDLAPYAHQAALDTLLRAHGLLTNRFSQEEVAEIMAKFWNQAIYENHKNAQLPKISVYLEQAVCACASLGFVPDESSGVSRTITSLRDEKVCANGSM